MSGKMNDQNDKNGKKEDEVRERKSDTKGAKINIKNIKTGTDLDSTFLVTKDGSELNMEGFETQGCAKFKIGDTVEASTSEQKM